MIDIQDWNNYVLIMVGYLNFSQMYMGIENFFFLGINSFSLYNRIGQVSDPRTMNFTILVEAPLLIITLRSFSMCNVQY